MMILSIWTILFIDLDNFRESSTLSLHMFFFTCVFHRKLDFRGLRLANDTLLGGTRILQNTLKTSPDLTGNRCKMDVDKW